MSTSLHAVAPDPAAVINELLRPGIIRAHFQPIVRLADSAVVAYEALARMDHPLQWGPDRYLEMAASIGPRDELELACMRAASLAGAPPNGAMLFVNVSPGLLSNPAALAMRADFPVGLVLELTEQAIVDDYDELRKTARHWKAQGVRIAVDDLGSGWSTLRHVVQLRPDVIKIDQSLISGVDRFRSQRALVCSMVAFAREAGCTVVAEGVERPEELQVLREAEVPLVQGFLLARPGPPWPEAELSSGPDRQRRHEARFPRTRLEDRLAEAADAREACNVVADYLWGYGSIMPSVYLERGGVLRCTAQRGLWQVLDGMPSGVGITGQAFETGRSVLVSDVSESPHYLEAIPGVVSELCVPVFTHNAVVGAVNVESHGPLSPDAVAAVEKSALLLGHRLDVLGTGAKESSGQRLARHASRLAEATSIESLSRRIVAALADVISMDSAALVLTDDDGELQVVDAIGPLAPVLLTIGNDDLSSLANLVDRVASCYTAGDSTGAGFSSVDGLRAAGTRAMVVVPLLKRERRFGLLLVADTTPMSLETDEAERIELIGAQASTCMDNLIMVEELRKRAEQDPLTGLRNHSAFQEALQQALESDGTSSLLLADIDRFKAINDQHGHLLGDEVLRRCAATFVDTVREIDQPFRIGGDEFALVIRGLGPVGSLALANRLVRAAAAVLAPYGAGLSIGISMLAPDDTRVSAFERADRALYEAKRKALGSRLSGHHDRLLGAAIS